MWQCFQWFHFSQKNVKLCMDTKLLCYWIWIWGGSQGSKSSIKSPRVRIIGFWRGEGQIWAKHKGSGCLVMQERKRSHHPDLDWSLPLSKEVGAHVGSAGVSTTSHESTRLSRSLWGIQLIRFYTKKTFHLLIIIFNYRFSDAQQNLALFHVVEDSCF